ncbi:MAG: hypothetical protein ACYC0V_14900 [Armatimonadota bacterium]
MAGRKPMRGLGSRIMTLILIGLLIYGVWQISVLRREVASLRTEVAQLKIINAGKSGQASAINEARNHLERAKDLAMKGNFEKSRVELQKGLDSLQKAGRDASAPSLNMLQSMQKKMRDTADNIQKLLEKVGAEPDKGKGGK